MSVEPQFSFLVFSQEKLVIRKNNVVEIDEKGDMADKLNNINTTLIFGAGYELGISKRLSVMLALNIEFRPFQGYYKNPSHIWASHGITVGVRYLPR